MTLEAYRCGQAFEHRRRLVLLGGHQVAVGADELVLPMTRPGHHSIAPALYNDTNLWRHKPGVAS